MIAFIVAAHLASTPPPLTAVHVKKRRHTAVKRTTSARANRELQLALLARRRAMLHDFLVEIGTEKPVLTDPRIVMFPVGIRVGPSSVDIDFLGSPIVRTRVTNESQTAADFLISVDLGPNNTGAADVERLAPGESRVIEIMGARNVRPANLRFAITRL